MQRNIQLCAQIRWKREAVDRRKWAMGVKRYAMVRKGRLRALIASCVEKGSGLGGCWVSWSVKLERRMILGGLYKKWFLENCIIEAPRPSVHLSKQSSFQSSSVCHTVDAINK